MASFGRCFFTIEETLIRLMRDIIEEVGAAIKELTTLATLLAVSHIENPFMLFAQMIFERLIDQVQVGFGNIFHAFWHGCRIGTDLAAQKPSSSWLAMYAIQIIPIPGLTISLPAVLDTPLYEDQPKIC